MGHKQIVLTLISQKQYIADEEKYVTNYIYLENFNQDMKALEKRFELKKRANK